MKITRKFTTSNSDPFASVKWVKRSSKISNPDGSVVFEMNDAEVPDTWSQLATDAAFGISRALRAGDVSLGTIDEAASLARDAVGYFTQNPGDGLPYAKDALCNVLIEQGRLARARATVEEGIGLCREAIAALSDKGRPHALVRIGKTVAYGEGVLAKL